MLSSPLSSMDDIQRSPYFSSVSSFFPFSDEKAHSVNNAIDKAIKVSSAVCKFVDHC